MHLTLWYIEFVYHQKDVCEKYIDNVYVGGYCGLNECVFGKLIFIFALGVNLVS